MSNKTELFKFLLAVPAGEEVSTVTPYFQILYNQLHIIRDKWVS